MGLGYESCTWESERDVGESDVTAFHDKNFPNPPLPFIRPSASTYCRPDVAQIMKDASDLSPAQLEGLTWVVFCWCHQRDCILVDEAKAGPQSKPLLFYISFSIFIIVPVLS
jgi:hypothetical protein